MTPPISGSTNSGDNDPALRISLEVDNESTLPMLLEGRTIAVLGRPLNNHTAESRIPQRRLQIHEQLLRARRLRASLEHAADLADSLPSYSPSSFPEAMAILQSSLPQMNQLVRLTEALRGNYTLEDSNEYDVWSEWAERQNELEDAQSKREQRAIRQQLRDFSREQNPGLQVEDELEAMHDSLIAKPKEVDAQVEQDATEEDPEEEDFGAQFYAQRKVVGATRASASKTQIQEEIDVAPDVEENIYSPGLDSNAESDDDDFDGDEFRAKRRRRKSSNQRKKRTKEKSSAQPAPSVAHKSAKRNAPTSDDIRDTSIASEAEKDHSKKAKVEKSMPTEDEKPAARKSPPESNEVATTSQTAERQSSPAAKSATATAARKPSSAPKSLKTRPLKKCHDCKKQSNKYRNCNYWKLSGNKCGKAFCTNCLSSKYSLGNDVLSPSNPSGIPIDEIVMCVALDVEWHCPSCLGSCQCSTCVKLRKKEEEREKSRLEASSRKSSRRSAAHLSGYFNFM